MSEENIEVPVAELEEFVSDCCAQATSNSAKNNG